MISQSYDIEQQVQKLSGYFYLWVMEAITINSPLCLTSWSLKTEYCDKFPFNIEN